MDKQFENTSFNNLNPGSVADNATTSTDVQPVLVSYGRKKIEKGTENYFHKRKKNNEAVKKSRSLKDIRIEREHVVNKFRELIVSYNYLRKQHAGEPDTESIRGLMNKLDLDIESLNAILNN